MLIIAKSILGYGGTSLKKSGNTNISMFGKILRDFMFRIFSS